MVALYSKEGNFKKYDSYDSNAFVAGQAAKIMGSSWGVLGLGQLF